MQGGPSAARWGRSRPQVDGGLAADRFRRVGDGAGLWFNVAWLLRDASIQASMTSVLFQFVFEKGQTTTMIGSCSSRSSLQRSCFHGSRTAPKPPSHLRPRPEDRRRADLLRRPEQRLELKGDKGLKLPLRPLLTCFHKTHGGDFKKPNPTSS